MLYFFLSYAHTDDDDLVLRFFDDLCKEVRLLAGKDRGTPVGFLDNANLQVGDAWRPDLVDALSRSQSFVALFSPRYLTSRPCGKEWQVFDRRLAAFERSNGRRPPALLPIFWVPTRVPDHLGDIQNRDRELGALYSTNGLRDLIRIARNQDDYLGFLTAMARRIFHTATTFPLPDLAVRPTYESVPSAFHPATADRPEPGRETDPAGTDPAGAGSASPGPGPVADPAPTPIPGQRRRPILVYDEEPETPEAPETRPSVM